MQQAAPPAGYFDLQLRVAARYAQCAGVPLREAVARCTNLRRRFGWMDAANAMQWERFLQGVDARAGAGDGQAHAALLRWACDAHAARTPPAPSPFGCFSHDAPDAQGTLRIHFLPVGPAQAHGPLSRARLPERLEELRALFRAVRRAHPQALRVRGLSWLYHRAAYLRLFPPGYAASAAPATQALHLSGSSTWGQAIDHHGRLRAAVRDAVLARLPRMDAAAPWRIFPLQPLQAEAPIAQFHDWYG